MLVFSLSSIGLVVDWWLTTCIVCMYMLLLIVDIGRYIELFSLLVYSMYSWCVLSDWMDVNPSSDVCLIVWYILIVCSWMSSVEWVCVGYWCWEWVVVCRVVLCSRIVVWAWLFTMIVMMLCLCDSCSTMFPSVVLCELYRHSVVTSVVSGWVCMIVVLGTREMCVSSSSGSLLICIVIAEWC